MSNGKEKAKKVDVLNNIVESFREKLLEGKPLFDFITINKNNSVDVKIFEKWKSFFKGKGVPFIITESDLNLTLFKIRHVKSSH